MVSHAKYYSQRVYCNGFVRPWFVVNSMRGEKSGGQRYALECERFNCERFHLHDGQVVDTNARV